MKYTYAFGAELYIGELRCTISYMPYSTNNYSKGFDGISVGSFDELMYAVAGALESESVNIHITDPSLTVDDMSKALQQMGRGWILCQLNRDATATTFTPLGLS